MPSARKIILKFEITSHVQCSKVFNYTVKELQVIMGAANITPWVSMFPNLEHLTVTELDTLNGSEVDLRGISLVSLNIYLSSPGIVAVHLYKTHGVETKYYRSTNYFLRLIETTEDQYEKLKAELSHIIVRLKSLERFSMYELEYY